MKHFVNAMRAPIMAAAVIALVVIASWAAVLRVPPIGDSAVSPFKDEIATTLKARCGECGIVESSRRIESRGQIPVAYEITVRLSDHSTRIFRQLDPAAWRPGERIILIGGGHPPPP